MTRCVRPGFGLGLAIVVLTACSAREPDAAFTAAHARWEQESPENYSFTLSAEAMVGSGSTRVTVERGRVTAAVPSGGRAPTAVTVEDVWTRLAKDVSDADRVTVAYDPVRGFPALVQVDQDRNSIDDERSYGVSGFTLP